MRGGARECRLAAGRPAPGLASAATRARPMRRRQSGARMGPATPDAAPRRAANAASTRQRRRTAAQWWRTPRSPSPCSGSSGWGAESSSPRPRKARSLQAMRTAGQCACCSAPISSSPPPLHRPTSRVRDAAEHVGGVAIGSLAGRRHGQASHASQGGQRSAAGLQGRPGRARVNAGPDSHAGAHGSQDRHSPPPHQPSAAEHAPPQRPCGSARAWPSR